ncbi:uncharacterized protein LOC110698960 [Chenopodium quinoa]|uniref:uncharacterized protein LOC110698960 n=1 Tax=Chenopodium quinoa TaxID=63459 RepID=UPI000B774D62|nr:uncharacterized protein LOC110698960 [Chenopodium quinoa]
MLLVLRNGKLPRGHLTHLARQFCVHKSTITRVFQDIKQQLEGGNVIDVRNKKIGKCGPKSREYTAEFLQPVPLHLRTTERGYAGALKISKSTLHELKKKGVLRTHTSTNKPRLTSNHKIARLTWVLSHIQPATHTSPPTFHAMNHVIHIDEKWFYLNPDTRRFYLLPNEEDPYRCEQSKRFKCKAMFMGIIGKPLFDEQDQLIHDGKYGIIPFVYQQLAKKGSKNRPAGTIETKATQNVNRGEIRNMLINEVLPAIRSKWPSILPKHVIIQWDNARPHQVPTDEEFLAALEEGGFNI